MPTARNRPSSRVRSSTDRARVLRMPNTAMTMARANSTPISAWSWSTLDVTDALY